MDDGGVKCTIGRGTDKDELNKGRTEVCEDLEKKFNCISDLVRGGVFRNNTNKHNNYFLVDSVHP